MFNLFRKNNLALYCIDSYVQILVSKGSDKNIKIGAYGQRNLPPGVIKDGVIMQEKQLAVEIITLLSELNIKDKNCIVALPKNHVFEHVIFIEASLNKAAFIQKLEEEIKKIIPIRFSELEYSYRFTTYGKVKAVFVIAAKRAIVDKYYEVLKSFCNLNPVFFESAASSLVRNIPIDLSEDKGKIVIDVYPYKTEWFILWKDDIFDSNMVIKVGEQDDIELLKKDLTESIENFHNQTKRKLTNIYLIGDSEKTSIISQIIEQSLQLKPELINNFRINLKNKKNDISEKFKILAGLALHKMNKKNSLNLIPNKHRKKFA